MGKQGNRFSEEFKKQAVHRLVHERVPVAQLARELGTTTSTLYMWRAKLEEHVAPPTYEGLSPQQQLKEMQRDIERLREENTILKKYAAYITKESQ
jgi:transposase